MHSYMSIVTKVFFSRKRRISTWSFFLKILIVKMPLMRDGEDENTMKWVKSPGCWNIRRKMQNYIFFVEKRDKNILLSIFLANIKECMVIVSDGWCCNNYISSYYFFQILSFTRWILFDQSQLLILKVLRWVESHKI